MSTSRNTWIQDKDDYRCEDSIEKEYKNAVFVPWTAVKYVKIVK